MANSKSNTNLCSIANSKFQFSSSGNKEGGVLINKEMMSQDILDR